MLLTVILLVLAIISDVTGDKLEECYSKCDRGSKCKALRKLAPWRVERCMKFLYDRCEESNDPFKCLDSYKSTRMEECTKNILKNGIPCAKCEAQCDLQDVIDNMPLDGQNAEKGKCYGECDAAEECQAIAAASITQANRCERYTDLMCGKSTATVVCLERLKNVENTRCPKAVRKNALKCMKCKDACENEDYGKKDDVEEKCYAECSKTKSCAILDSASDHRLESCQKLTDANCATNSDPVSCLKSIKTIRNLKCPKDFRKHVVTCTECDMKCSNGTAPANSSPRQGTEVQSGENSCFAKCDNTEDCMTVDSASDDRVQACESFLSSNCGEQEDDTTCLDRLNDTSNANCPADFRKRLSSCIKCDDECEPTISQNDEMSPQLQMCLDACSNTSSCVAMENAADEAVAGCEEIFVRQCGQNSDIVACMESYSNEDASCSSALRMNIIKCMKCDQTCEEVPSQPPPLPMTRSKCEKSCDSSLGCDDSGGVSSACKECISAQCESGDLTCLVTAIAVDCREQCFLANAGDKKQLCDDCKVSCSKYS